MIRLLAAVLASMAFVAGTIVLGFVSHALGVMWGHPKIALVVSLLVWVVVAVGLVHVLMRAGDRR